MSEAEEHTSEELQQSQQQSDLGNELRELGQQLEQAFRGVFENERAKTLQRDFIAGIREIGNQMQEGLSTLKDNPHVQNLAERGQQAVNQAQETPPAKEFQRALTRGVSLMKEQIETFNTRMAEQASKSSQGTQNIAIEHEEGKEAATGETTYLDPDKQEG